jgi:hypothetical protein
MQFNYQVQSKNPLKKILRISKSLKWLGIFLLGITIEINH